MGRKVFVTYKYSDNKVKPIAGDEDTTARTYVDRIQEIIGEGNHIFKGESEDESLEEFKESTVRGKLKDKIFDSSVTIIVISKGMKNHAKEESDQWIPWEVSYSLRKKSRKDKSSIENALVGVVIPDEKGSYGYFYRKSKKGKGRTIYTNKTFGIIQKNLFNCIDKDQENWKGQTIYKDADCSYIHCVRWDDFKKDMNTHIEKALQIRENIENYELVKQV